MADRRLFLKQLAGYLTGFLLTFINWISQPEISWGAARRLLPKGTRLETLVNENPALIDARNLEIQPLEKFGTMGLSDHATDLNTWRLTVSGEVNVLVVGVLLVFFVVAAPEGIVGLFKRFKSSGR